MDSSPSTVHHFARFTNTLSCTVFGDKFSQTAGSVSFGVDGVNVLCQNPYYMSPVKEEIDLHGLTVDEAVIKLDRFIHTAFQRGLYFVWIIHGKGSGKLRQEVGRYLSCHPLVKSYGSADSSRGGTGATRAVLSDR
jgi:dsDNA-specific endonuclease/ATPase MutS2